MFYAPVIIAPVLLFLSSVAYFFFSDLIMPTAPCIIISGNNSFLPSSTLRSNATNVARLNRSLLNGSWESSAVDDEYDEFLRRIGVNWFMRSAAQWATPTETFSIEDGVLYYEIHIPSVGRRKKFAVPLGKWFNERSVDGMMRKSFYWIDNGHLVCKQLSVAGTKTIETYSERKVFGDEMIMTHQVDELNVWRTFKRINAESK